MNDAPEYFRVLSCVVVHLIHAVIAASQHRSIVLCADQINYVRFSSVYTFALHATSTVSHTHCHSRFAPFAEVVRVVGDGAVVPVVWRDMRNFLSMSPTLSFSLRI